LSSISAVEAAAQTDPQLCAYEIIPTQPMHRWKVAWESTRKVAKVSCRFHDLRHTFISRLAESQASDSTVMALAGHLSRAMMERPLGRSSFSAKKKSIFKRSVSSNQWSREMTLALSRPNTI
jgi:integrase